MASPMNYQSTNVDGAFVHFGGAVVSGKQQGHGIELNPTQSTAAGNIPTITACGDDADISIALIPKGAGGLFLGSTTGSGIVGGAQRSTFTSEFAAISSGQIVECTLSTAVTLANLGDLVVVEGLVTAPAVLAGWRLSSVVTSRVTLTITNPTSTATSTGRIVGSVTYLDLT